MEVHTADNDGLCGYKFIEGESYLVYGGYSEGLNGLSFGTSICSRTKPLKDATEDFAVLGTGRSWAEHLGGRRWTSDGVYFAGSPIPLKLQLIGRFKDWNGQVGYDPNSGTVEISGNVYFRVFDLKGNELKGNLRKIEGGQESTEPFFNNYRHKRCLQYYQTWTL